MKAGEGVDGEMGMGRKWLGNKPSTLSPSEMEVPVLPGSTLAFSMLAVSWVCVQLLSSGEVLLLCVLAAGDASRPRSLRMALVVASLALLAPSPSDLSFAMVA